MNILSLFDGMSCGRIALERAGIPVDNYFASEIDKPAIQVSADNYPDIIRLGDVRDLDVSSLPPIDLLIGGSPCTNFSFAGKRNGMTTKCKIGITNLDHYLQLKADGFQFEGQSYLFWEYMRIKHDLIERNPDLIFLLENVMMSEKWKQVFTDAIGLPPIMINSALVSAQNRKRLYWTNIEGIEQPEDKGILLGDILETGDLSDYTHSDKALTYMSRKTHDGGDHWDFGHHCDSGEDKSKAMVANLYKGVPFNVIIDRRVHSYNRKTGIGKQLNKAYTLNASDWRGLNRNQNQNCVVKSTEENSHYRKLTPIECERLQTLPDNYSKCVSNTQRLKMIGNGWTVDVITHMFLNIPWYLLPERSNEK